MGWIKVSRNWTVNQECDCDNGQVDISIIPWASVMATCDRCDGLGEYTSLANNYETTADVMEDYPKWHSIWSIKDG